MAVQYRGLGEVEVVAAGTPVPLSPDQIISAGCLIQARSDNAGTVYVGGPNLGPTTRGNVLGPGDALEIVGPTIAGTEDEFNLAEIYIDAENSGDKVNVSYFIRKP